MPRFRNFTSLLGFSSVMALGLLALAMPLPAVAPTADGAGTQPALGAPTAGPDDCARAPEVADPATPLSREGTACDEDPTGGVASDGTARGGRTCKCSCGYPCKTDADCGGAIGSCRGGVSCC